VPAVILVAKQRSGFKGEMAKPIRLARMPLNVVPESPEVSAEKQEIFLFCKWLGKCLPSCPQMTLQGGAGFWPSDAGARLPAWFCRSIERSDVFLPAVTIDSPAEFLIDARNQPNPFGRAGISESGWFP
jgi:hypothetical protein